MKDYTEAKIRSRIRKGLQENLNLFYKEKFLNYTGKTLDTEVLYTEIIADELIKNFDRVSLIGQNELIRRTKSFNVNHNGVSIVTSRLKKYGRLEYCEKLLAVALYNSKKISGLGEIIDYEVPLKESQSDQYGKIDLVSKDIISRSIKLIELKINNHKGKDETLLRALLEIYTYYKLIICSNSKRKFFNDFELSIAKYPYFTPVILTDKIALSGNTILNIQTHPNLQKLISAMNRELGEKIEAFVYEYPNRGKAFPGDAQAKKQRINLRGEINIKRII